MDSKANIVRSVVLKYGISANRRVDPDIEHQNSQKHLHAKANEANFRRKQFRMKTTFWEIDPAHSEIHFKIRHLVISTVTGAFRIFKGTLQTSDKENFEDAVIDMTIDTYSLDTNETDRDEHLKSPEFFNADQYPEITLK